MSGLVTAWLAEVILISYRATKKGSNQGTTQVPLPRPGQYAATFVIYGALGLLPASAGGFAALVGWGIVAATLLNLYQPLGASSATPKVAQTGDSTATGQIAG